MILGQVLTAAQGQNPARQAARARRHPRRQTAFGDQPGLRLRPAHRGARRPADPHRRERDRRRRRPGEHEPVDPRRLSARGREDGRPRPDRHHDQGRAVGRLQRLPHGHHGRERRAPIPDHPRAAGRVRGPPASRRRARRRRPAGSRTRSRRSTIKGRKGDTVVADDEYIRHDSSLEAMAKLRPAFSKDGTVTAGNASGINDGAAALVVMSAERGAAARPHAARPHRQLRDRRRRSGGDGHRADPAPAARRCERAGWKAGDLDLVEANEAFAAQACAVNKDLGWDTDQVNVNGGAIAHRPPDRRLGRPRAGDAAARDAASATPRRAWRRSASAAAWASRCASSGPDRGNTLNRLWGPRSRRRGREA